VIEAEDVNALELQMVSRFQTLLAVVWQIGGKSCRIACMCS
jgi:hypothetical protein